MKIVLLLVIAMTSFQALAQRYEIGRGTKSVKITQATTDIDVTLSIPLYKVEDRVVVERVTCRIPSCSTEQGDGSEGNWHGFFTVKNSEKAAALAAAIKGIGKATAEKIVENELFTFKPDSWNEFTKLINKIERQLSARGYNYKFATQVTEQYGYDNLISLGYGNERSCRTVETVCDQVSIKEFKTLSHYIARELTVVVKNQSLQSFETDILTITAGTEKADVRASVVGSNNYEATLLARGTILELDGTRILNAMPIEGSIVSLTKDANTNFVMNLSVPAKMINTEDKGSSIVATYDMCRADIFGGCFSVVGGPWSSSLVGNKLTKSFTTTGLKTGSKFFMRVRLNKVDSKFYSENKSARISTNSVRK